MEDKNNKLIKLLNLTTSNFDGEALNAIRKANDIIKKGDVQWENIILTENNKRIETLEAQIRDKQAEIDNLKIEIDELKTLNNAYINSNRPCPRCGSPLVIRFAKKGTGNKFVGCSSYPDCKYTERISILLAF